MKNLKQLDRLLKKQSLNLKYDNPQQLMEYARQLAAIENVVTVVSDLKNDTSCIFSGKFGSLFGLEPYSTENSIWEKNILNRMTEKEQEEKYLAELRFYNYVRHLPHNMRPYYYLASKLRISTITGDTVSILHRMYYIYSEHSDSVRYALCIYGCMVFDFPGKSVAVNSMTGITEELSPVKDTTILSKREKQVLKLIDIGKTSADIAHILSISIHTVNRHRQEILKKLQVRNSAEACRTAKSVAII